MAENTFKYVVAISIALIAIMYGNSQVTEIVPKQVSYQESYQVPYQESYQDPIYKSYVSGHLVRPTTMWENSITTTFEKYESIDIKSSVPGLSIKDSYDFTVILCENKTSCNTYTNVFYEYKTDNVIIGYDTKYKTSYRTLYRTAYRTENTPITKTRFEWLFN